VIGGDGNLHQARFSFVVVMSFIVARLRQTDVMIYDHRMRGKQ
jgi:hypothetical protein